MTPRTGGSDDPDRPLGPGPFSAEVSLPAEEWSGEDRTVEARVLLTDLAGNTAELPVGTVHYDGTPPDRVDTPGAASLLLFRAPWGTAEAPGRTRTELRICLGPGGAGQWDWCRAGQSPLEHEALIRVFGTTPSAEGVPVCAPGRLLAERDMSGQEADWGVVSLALDVADVCVTQSDRAGNESEGALVTDVEWVATLGAKVAARTQENPHRLVARPWFTEALLQADDRELGEADGAAEPDGRGAVVEGAAGDWRLHRFEEIPARPAGTAMAYDSARGRLLLHGGRAFAGTRHDTWSWDGVNWSELHALDPEGDGDPTWAGESLMAYDSRSDAALLLDGVTLWEWRGSSWRLLATRDPGDAVGARSPDSAMAFDRGRARLVQVQCVPAQNDLLEVWEWDGERWERMEAAAAPGASQPVGRTRHALVYDDARQRVLMFGGEGPDGPLGDLWAWDGETWEERQSQDPEADGEPRPRRDHALAYDPARDRVVLFGGGSADFPDDALTWEWDGRGWQRIVPADPERDGQPAERLHCEMAYDTVRGETVLFGGWSPGNDLAGGETWTWNGRSWRRRGPADPGGDGQPAARHEGQGYTPTDFLIRGRFVCFPRCGGRECGEDGCGGRCGEPCPPATTCSAAGRCVPSAMNVAGATAAQPISTVGGGGATPLTCARWIASPSPSARLIEIDVHPGTDPAAAWPGDQIIIFFATTSRRVHLDSGPPRVLANPVRWTRRHAITGLGRYDSVTVPDPPLVPGGVLVGYSVVHPARRAACPLELLGGPGDNDGLYADIATVEEGQDLLLRSIVQPDVGPAYGPMVRARFSVPVE